MRGPQDPARLAQFIILLQGAEVYISISLDGLLSVDLIHLTISLCDDLSCSLSASLRTRWPFSSREPVLGTPGLLQFDWQPSVSGYNL